MIPKINLVSSLAALALFFLPWIDIQCSNKSFATQTGVQTICGKGTTSKEFDAGKSQSSSSSDKDESMGYSILAGVALIAVVAAVVCSFLLIRGTAGLPRDLVGMLCAVAFAALAGQMMLGFPVKGKIDESMSESVKRGNNGDPFAGAGIAATMMMNIQVNYLPAIYCELFALGVPTLILANRLLDKLKKAEPEA